VYVHVKMADLLFHALRAAAVGLSSFGLTFLGWELRDSYNGYG
jgi:hypothetical protein